MKKKWILQHPSDEAVSLLAKNLNISERLAKLLVNRGIEDLDDAKRMLSGTFQDLPSPFLMKDMKKAVDRLLRAIDQKESIFIYGDYDVDGVTATSCLLTFFRELGVAADYHIPHRLKEGYGLHRGALEEIKSKGGEVVITADCGISNVKEAVAASELGIDLIITDHHIVPPDLPEAHAVLNPLRKDSDYPDLNLSGVGVAFQLIIALRQALRERGHFNEHREPNLRSYLDLVALGTIADLVPLRGVNHILVKEGLKVLSSRRRAGIKALSEVSGIKKEKIGTYEVGFQLGPRLNAGGRLSSAALGVELLTTADFFTALTRAQTLDTENSKRRLLQEEILLQATAMLKGVDFNKQRSIVLSSPTWHPGVIGIVASKLIERHYRPTCLIAEDKGIGKGSARSVQGLHLLDAICESKELFENFGGHKAAAGFSIKADKIDEFRKQFEATVSSKLTADDYVPKAKVDLELSMNDIDESLLSELDQLSPYGMGNPEPTFITKDFKVLKPKIVGKDHLKLRLEGGSAILDAIGFQMGQYLHDAHKMASILHTPGINEWQGRRSIQLKLKNISF